MSELVDRKGIDTIRALAMDAVQAANSGHPGTPMALAPLGYLIFSRLRRHDPATPEWPDRDRFVLSCGHASMLQYALLHLFGYGLTLDDLKQFRQWGSKTPGHPEYGHTVGVEVTTGPLGQGVANAVGMAMAEKHLAARFNRPGHVLIDHKVWVIASDGDLMEGVSAEASSLAGHLKLGKLIVFYDDNRITIDGTTDLSFKEDVCKRYDAYGWHTLVVEDGNDLAALEQAARAAEKDPRPSLIRVRTVIGDPSPGKKGSSDAHGAPLGTEEIAKTKAIMGWPIEPTFFVPPEASAIAAHTKERGAKFRSAWEERWSRYRQEFPAEALEFEKARSPELAKDFGHDIPAFPPDPKGMATRKASQTVIAELAKRIPNFVGGSADLAHSNLTYQKGFAAFNDAEGVPRNVHFGVREHGMGAILNGMALHGGVVPYGATFLIFSDYLRPTLRLASLMGLRTRFVFTHDSIGLGEDGPTHQPIEQLASLRAIPGMAVFRPGDANEVLESWKAALNWPGPAALVLSRQNVPTLDRAGMGDARLVHRGAYILRDAVGGPPEVILLATGTEVPIALKAADELQAAKVRARVVSVPCFELFAKQDQAYRDLVLPPGQPKRVVVEAATRFGWERLAGSAAAFCTIDHFGASAPAEVLYEKFGLSPKAVAAAALKLVSR